MIKKPVFRIGGIKLENLRPRVGHPAARRVVIV